MKRVLAALAVIVTLSAASLTQASSTSGPGNRFDTVNAPCTDRYTVAFYGGETAQVRLHSYGSTYLVLEVRDENGNVVASDNDRSGDALVTWTPAWTGAFTIRVINPATVPNLYLLSTN